MRIVVTGGEGYIGSALLPQLAGRFELPVISVDNDSGPAGEIDAPATQHPLITRIRADILEFPFRDFFLSGDIVIHLAAIADPARSLTEPELVEEVNVRGTQSLAMACRDRKIPILFPSTTSVYGSHSSEDQSLEALSPQSPYAATKLKAEKLLRDLGASGLRYESIRFGTVFGASPRLRFHPAINKFCLQAAMGKSLTVWRTALNQTRPYLQLSDAVNVLCFLIERKEFSNRTFNAVSVNASVAEILRSIRKEVPGLRFHLEENWRMNELSYETFCGNFSRLGFVFSGTLEEGIRSLFENLRTALKI